MIKEALHQSSGNMATLVDVTMKIYYDNQDSGSRE